MTKQQIIYSAFWVGTLISSSWLVWHAHQSLYAHRALMCIYDQQITPLTQQAVTKKITLFLAQNACCSAQQLFEHLRSEFPALTKISLNYFMPGSIKITAAFGQPLIMIHRPLQTPYVVTRESCYTTSQHYQPYCLDGLPCIVVTETDFGPTSKRALFAWAQQRTPDFFLRYTTTWHKPTEIILHDHHYPALSYSVTDTTDVDTMLEQHCNAIHLKAAGNHKKYKKWNVDMRFKNQIIMKGVL